jgi:CheY-like chemotaxis protein
LPVLGQNPHAVRHLAQPLFGTAPQGYTAIHKLQWQEECSKESEETAMRTILVAEDREASRELVRTLLEHCGYAVLEAKDGAEAVQVAKATLPDLVLLDLHMPLKDGFEVLQELRCDERFTATPIVALTASAMMGDKANALMKGFTAYLTKPLSLAVIRRELARLLDRT